MSKTKKCFALLQVWEGGAYQLIACYAKKADADNRRDFIARLAKAQDWVVIEVPFVVSLK